MDRGGGRGAGGGGGESVSVLQRRRQDSAIKNVKLSIDAKNFRVARRFSTALNSKDGSLDEGEGGGGATKRTGERMHAATALNEDVAIVDRLLNRVSRYVVVCWAILVIFSYWIVPPGSIRRYSGMEWNAALVNLLLLTTTVLVKYMPLLWDIKLKDMSAPSPASDGRRTGTMMVGRTQISGILYGGLVTQFIAVMTVVIMVAFPVPVMIDPILGSKVNLIRWCEWTPLAGYMTLMTECIDAPEYSGGKLTQAWRKKFEVSGLMSLSTICGLVFPFCTNLYVWVVVMTFSFVTYSAIIVRYFEKRKLFRLWVWSGGGSVDEIELYERARMSLTLHGVCCSIWTLITVQYFVTSCGHLIVPKTWTMLHDPAAMMIGECTMDLISKCLYMSLIVEAHQAAFDEVRRANRRLSELRNAMNVVWENSSDCIAISVQKVSGSTSSMVSPSFFRSALVAGKEEMIQNITAIVLEHSSLAVQSHQSINEPFTNSSRMKESEVPNVGIKIVRKDTFAGVDIHYSGNDDDTFECVGSENEVMTCHVASITEILAQAWQIKEDEIMFDYETAAEDESIRTKFEVKVTRLEENAIVMVVRNVSEKYRRFEAEKKFVFESTARLKDAQANRFTRHEVKNGLLAAIEICGNVREQLSEPVMSHESLLSNLENMTELDRTLHDILDIILAETMARDVIQGMYVPRMECIDMNDILGKTNGFGLNNSRFSLVCSPSPMPIIVSDKGLFKCIYGNVIRNAIKYGKLGGKIATEAKYDEATGEFELKVINLPGRGHDKLVMMGKRASELVFSHGTRLHNDTHANKQSYSAGDGAWIIRNCANILGGKVEIMFEPDRTVFLFNAPMKIHRPSFDVDKFHLPPSVWGIAIDDSKIQRKLLERFFHHAGVPATHQIVLGQNSDEISGFVNFVLDLVKSHPRSFFFLIVDENLEMDDGDASSHKIISGSECIKQIRTALDPEQEMRMLALVRSANDSPQDLALYRSRAHGYMQKVPLRGISVRETVSRFWTERFPPKDGGNQGGDNVENSITRKASVENIRDLTLISPVELLLEVEDIDSFCVQNFDNYPHYHSELWEKIIRLKGDLKTVNVDEKFTPTINLIETIGRETELSDFMTIWLRIRSDIVSFVSQN
ncbi:hypothetical protein ACHAXA_004583 [Cyclostephanos tholiformis]|uniref:Uncharacterized protein n=1 Tax=Cyclostephanos tholiformis TaxID=382380 RepID=A0ABD3R9A1_9STRA